jgi:heptosyltransferase-2
LTRILILKTGALGDVLRTTSILPGLAARYPAARITWVTAPGAVDLIRLHPLVHEIETLDVDSPSSIASTNLALAAPTWDLVISLDDEEPLCQLASSVPARRLSGAYLRDDGVRAYTSDVAPWFDMGLLSVHGKLVADRLKIENRRSHAAILADMLGIASGQPQLGIEPENERFAERFARRSNLRERGAVVGLNTGAGGRWISKALTPERTAQLAVAIDRALEGRVKFVLFGGLGESERNARIASLLAREVEWVDSGLDNRLLDFAALVGLCDVMITSDSLALHVALARRVRTVAFFAPTSAAEIELFGLGEKVVSTAPDYCSYKPDADTSTLTPERIAAAALRQLAARG